MKIFVPVKRVIDYAAKIRVKPDRSGVDTNGVRMSTNPFDEIAIEEAVRLKEKGIAKEIVAVTLGPKQSEEVLRSSLAIGADQGIIVNTDKPLNPLSVAKLLQKLVETEKPNLIIMGKQAIDDDCNQTAQMLAGLLKWPQATFASKIEFNDSKDSIKVTREIDGGLETLSMKLPAVVSCDLRLNEPRYAKLANIMKAKKVPLTTKTPEELDVQINENLKSVTVEEPAKRSGGSKVTTVDEIVASLKKHSLI